MAYRRRSARVSTRRPVRSRRSRVSAPRRRSASRGVRSRTNRSAPQTVRIVIEQPSAAPIGRELLGKTIDNSAPKKAKF